MSEQDKRAKQIAVLFEAADALRDAFAAVQRVAFDVFPAADALLDQPHYVGDLDTVAKLLSAIADEAQEALDAEVA